MPGHETENTDVPTSTGTGTDVEMAEGGVAPEVQNTTNNGIEAATNELDMTEQADDVEGDPIEGAEVEEVEKPEQDDRSTFVNYLMSPVVTLLVGNTGETTLFAHQALLSQSPYFEKECSIFVDDGSPRTIELPDDDIQAVGCFLEFLYTGEYFPRKLPGQRAVEDDPGTPAVDDTGDQLLRHARIYTLAEKFGMETLKKLASSKIHCINSTAKGEIAFARYVYAYTDKDDSTIRAPVAKFWATRSHTLRAEAEVEFKALCLEFPEFGYEVLTRVLDDKLKRERTEKMHPSSSVGSTRKRARQSSGAA